MNIKSSYILWWVALIFLLIRTWTLDCFQKAEKPLLMIIFVEFYKNKNSLMALLTRMVSGCYNSCNVHLFRSFVIILQSLIFPCQTHELFCHTAGLTLAQTSCNSTVVFECTLNQNNWWNYSCMMIKMALWKEEVHWTINVL